MRRISATTCLIFLFFTSCFCCAQGTPDDNSFSDFFPAWTNGYLEIKDLSGFSREYITAIPSTKTSTKKKFGMLVQNNLGISSEVFVKEFLGKHFALGWGGPSVPNQFGLICRIKNKATIMNFLSASQASAATQAGRASDSIRTFHLPNTKIRAAVLKDSLLILATTGAGMQADMFGAMVDIANGELEKTLSRNPNFQQAKKHFKKDYKLFATFLGNEDELNLTGRKNFIFSRLFQPLQYLTIGMYPVGNSIRCEIIAQVDKVDPVFWPEDTILLGRPMSALLNMKSNLTYCGVIDPDRWYDRIVSLSQQGSVNSVQYRRLLELVLPNEYLRKDFLASLGPEMMLIITQGKDKIASTQPATQPNEKTSLFGDISLIIRTANPSASIQAMEQMSRTITDFLAVQSLVIDRNVSKTNLDRHLYNGFVINVLKTNNQHLHQFCWTVAGEYIFLSSRREMLYKLVDTAFKDEEQDAESFEIPEVTHWLIVFDPSALAERFEYLGNPLSQIWNRFQDRFSSNPIKLGIGTRILQNKKNKEQRLAVAAILPGYPAWGKVQIGDIITSVNGESLDKVNIQEDFNRRIKESFDDLGEIKLTLIRNEIEHSVKITSRRPALENSVKLLRLVHNILESLGKKFKTVNLNCGYTPAGEIDIRVEMKKK